MRAALAEVLGEERAMVMYSIDWLADRVRFDLDPLRSTAQIFMAIDKNNLISGHCIVRLETTDEGMVIRDKFDTLDRSSIECAQKNKVL